MELFGLKLKINKNKMKNTLIYITLAILALAMAFYIYKWLADEPILPRVEPVEKTNFSPEYKPTWTDNFGK